MCVEMHINIMRYVCEDVYCISMHVSMYILLPTCIHRSITTYYTYNIHMHCTCTYNTCVYIHVHYKYTYNT